MASDNIQNSRRENATSELHRRNSSVWKPEMGVLYNPIEVLRSKSTRVKGSRVIPPNHLEEVKRYNLPNYRHFADNSVSTTTYKLFDSPLGIFYAIPRNLIHQFVTKWANWVFLFIAVINFFPVVGAYNKWLSLFPPAFVLTTTMLKDFYEDYRRYRSDREVNNKLCKVWDSEKKCFRKIKWKKMLVGDVVRVSNDEDIPADILFLRSSDEMGVCYVETSNLDGETSLKQRSVPKRYLDWSKETQEDLISKKFTATILCEKPDRAIYTVNAKLKYEPGDDGRCDVITKENMLLRGSKLKNTTWVEGCIMYAGPDTKVMVNNDGARHKTSAIEDMTNWFILICCIMLLLMVLSGGILCAIFQDEKGTINVSLEVKKKNGWIEESRNVPNVPYMPINIWKPAISGLFDVLTLIICYQVIVPISLYITIDIIKMFQIKFINMDIDLYDAETDHRIDCRTWNIPEDLGQITHILSDKTGTLTENKMVFRKCAIDDNDYGGEFDHDSLDHIQAVASEALKDRIKRNWQSDERLKHFMRCIVLNNTVIVNKKPRQDVMDIGTYDEEEGVYTISNSAFFNFPAEEYRRMRDAVLPTPAAQEDNRHSWGTLSNIPEDTETVVSMPSSPQYSVVAQAGATPTESSIVRKTSRVSSFANAAWRTVTKPITLIFYPTEGTVPLRMRGATMVMDDEKSPYEAESPDELALLQGAQLYGFRLEARSMNHVVYEQPDENMKNVKVLLMLPFDHIRKRMSVIVESPEGPLMYTKGADYAILKSLNEQTSSHKSEIERMVNKYSCQGLRTLCFAMKYLTNEEFEDFKKSYEFTQTLPNSDVQKEQMISDQTSQIETKLTLLGVTGIEDRLQDGVCETVTSLREAGIQIWVLTGDKLETAENIARASGLFEENLPIYTINCVEDFNPIKKIDEEKQFNLILSPDVVKTMKENADVVGILKRTKCVLCYRMAPAQKAEVVKYVKEELKARSLAIGDGANDVPMIQEAHIGIGVKGKEGMQAVMSSDFAIARFKFLKKLLLVHGHWSYYRSALIFLYFLYKNANCVFILFYYQFFDGYSGAYAEDPTYSVLYPIIFTSVQPIVVGVFDQDYEADELLKKPHLYRSGREGTSYTYTLFFLNMLDAMWQAAIVYFFTHLSLLGNTDGLWYFGFYLATGMMFVNSFHLMLEVRYWTHILTGIFAAFFVLHFAFFAVWCMIVPLGSINDPPTEVFNTATSNINFWLCLFSITIVALLPRFLLSVLHNSGLTFSVLNK